MPSSRFASFSYIFCNYVCGQSVTVTLPSSQFPSFSYIFCNYVCGQSVTVTCAILTICILFLHLLQLCMWPECDSHFAILMICILFLHLLQLCMWPECDSHLCRPHDLHPFPTSSAIMYVARLVQLLNLE